MFRTSAYAYARSCAYAHAHSYANSYAHTYTHAHTNSYTNHSGLLFEWYKCCDFSVYWNY
jgi:hypothetical protein